LQGVFNYGILFNISLNLENRMKYHNYIPIKKDKDVDINIDLNAPIGPKEIRHLHRQRDAITEFIAKISDICSSKEIKQLFLDYGICLVESENGSKKIGITYPQKRFY
jgi:hypothetical protein